VVGRVCGSETLAQRAHGWLPYYSAAEFVYRLPLGQVDNRSPDSRRMFFGFKVGMPLACPGDGSASHYTPSATAGRCRGLAPRYFPFLARSAAPFGAGLRPRRMHRPRVFSS
jgi:hypothetical protein